MKLLVAPTSRMIAISRARWQHRDADRHADDHDRHDREREADDQPDDRRQLPELVEPLDPFPPVAHVVDEAEVLAAARPPAGRAGAPEGGA